MLTPGTRVGPYELLSLIGSGGMGNVYAARDSRLGRKVAIKVLATHLMDDAELRMRFDREARAAAAVSHPNICYVFDIGWQDDTPYIVMEHLEGQNLAARLQGGPLAPAVAVALAIQIAEALRETHQHGVIHRDLKPSNVMLTPAGVKLVDFGVAKLKVGDSSADASISTHTPATEQGTVLGTYQYMAPEQLEGREVDHRVDVFSLGALLYEMLTGTSPFAASSKAGVITAVLTWRPPAPGSLVPEVPRELDALVLDCLSKSRDGRPTSDRVVRRLQAISQPAHSAPTTISHRRQQRSIKAIAVLPVNARLKNESVEAFSDGVTDGLISALARFRSLRVISRASSLRYRGTSVPISQIARDLQVDAVLATSVSEDDTGRLSLTAELVNAATESRLWSSSYLFERTAVLQVQEQVADDLAGQFNLSGTHGKGRRSRRAAVSKAGHEAYLKARFLFENRIGDWFESSFEALQTAISHDPEFAPAHAALSKWYTLAAARKAASPADWTEALRRSESEARLALTLDPRLGEAHVALGRVLGLRWEFAEAEAAFQKALTVEPDAIAGHAGYSEFLTYVGRSDDAIRHINAAKDRDPFATSSYERLAGAHYAARNFAACAEAAAAGLELSPDAGVLMYFKGQAAAYSGDLTTAIETLRAAKSVMSDHPAVVAALATALVRAGRQDEAAELLSGLLAKGADLVHVSEAYAALGKTREALDALEKAFQHRSPELLNLAVDPAFDPLRSHPRFARLLRAIGLPTLRFATV